MSVFFRQEWTEHRLAYEDTGTNVTEVFLHYDIIGNLHSHPDLGICHIRIHKMVWSFDKISV